MLQNHLGQYERGESRSKMFRKLQNFISTLPKTDNFDQKQPKILENWGRFIGMKLLLINLGRGQALVHCRSK